MKAQKLLFAHTEYGDLTPLFSAYFDTTIGAKAKAETTSCQQVARALELPADEILFLSDVDKELTAAAQAGMQIYY